MRYQVVYNTDQPGAFTEFTAPDDTAAWDHATAHDWNGQVVILVEVIDNHNVRHLNITTPQEPEPVKFGDYVTTNKHGHTGRVTEIHQKCPQSPGWIKGQRIPVTEAELTEPWVSILIKDNGGAAVTPMSDCEVVAPFDLNNRWASTHFND